MARGTLGNARRAVSLLMTWRPQKVDKAEAEIQRIDAQIAKVEDDIFAPFAKSIKVAPKTTCRGVST